MNKVYRLIRSRITGRLVPVAEMLPAGCGKAPGRSAVVGGFIAAALLAMPVHGQDLPSGGQIVAGSGTITTSGNAMTIEQSSERLIANWQSFSIGENHSVTFHQPGASSVALNRVIGHDVSRILGTLDANGQVFLLNPNGVVIGRNASVQTGAFVASTLELADDDFLAGQYRFTAGENPGGIVNQGEVSGSVVALIAPAVRNGGTLEGDTALAAGTNVLLDFDGDGLISVEVAASTLATLVENHGLIQADGGLAILTARGASEALKGVINNTGTVQADTVANRNGRILLLGDMSTGEVKAAGTLKASFVETSAAQVDIDSGLKVDTGGGEWLIDPVDIVIDAAKATAIETALGSGDVTVTTADSGSNPWGANGSGSEAGNITVDAPITWSSNILTLRADNDIVINESLISTGATTDDGLVLRYAQTTSTGDYYVNAPVNLAAGSLFQTQKGADPAITYTVITSLGTEASSNDGTLQGMVGNLTGNYVLGADIDASDTENWSSGQGFTPVGTVVDPFEGRFDGLGHTISGLTIDRINQGVGLFGLTAGASIRNVGLLDVSVTGVNTVGALVGGNAASEIRNAYVTGTVNGLASVGGLVGQNLAGSQIGDSYTTATVTGQISVGGLVGYNAAAVTSSYATGNVDGVGAGSQIGGLIGLNGVLGVVTSSYATGNVDGTARVGGLIGGNEGTVTESYASGAASAASIAGGLVGRNFGTGIVNKTYATGTVSATGSVVGGLVGGNEGTVTESYATGAVAGSLDMGQLVGINNGGTVSDSYWEIGTPGSGVGCGNNAPGSICTASGLATQEIKDPFTFIDAGWDLASVWGKSSLGENDGYLMLRWQDASLYDDYVRLSGNTNRTYGGANPALNGISLSGLGTGNVSLAWGSAITATTNAGAYAYSDPNVLDVTTSSPGGVYVDYGSDGLTIDPAPLTITANDLARTYDGTSFSGGNGVNYSGFVNGEDESVLGGALVWGGTAQGARNAGSYTLAPSGLTSGNYAISYVDGTLTIEPAAITLSSSDVVKTYDGTLSANGVATITAGQLFGTDTLSGGTFAFTDPNAGSNKTVTVSGVTINDGNGGNNYAVTYVHNTTSTITPASLTVTANDLTRTYDGTSFSGGNGVVYAGFVNGEDESVLGGTLAWGGSSQGARNAGSYTLAPSGLTSGNYAVSYVDGTLTIDPAAITLSTSDVVKTYDGTLSANGLATVTAGQLFGTDTLSGGTFAFTDRNAGTNKTVTVSGVTIDDGNGGNNYIVTYVNNTTSTITPAPLTLSGLSVADKIYDGSTSATIVNAGTLAGIIGGDSVDFTYSGATFFDRHAGIDKPVTLNGISLTGADAGNYAWAGGAPSTTATITPATISLTGISANDKVFDGTTLATLDTSGAVFTGVIPDDELTIASATGAFEDATPGVDKHVSITGITLGGEDAGNYVLDSTTASATADILPLAVNPPFFPEQVERPGVPGPAALIDPPPLIETVIRADDEEDGAGQ